MKISQSCQVTYERIVDLNEEDTTEDKASRISPSEIPPKSPPKHDITEEELKYCFRRLILTAPAPPTSGSVKLTPDDHLDRAAEDDLALEKLRSTLAAISEFKEANKASDGGLRWIVSDDLGGFKSKENMQTVRQAAMASYMKTEQIQEHNKSRANSEVSDHSRSSVGSAHRGTAPRASARATTKASTTV